MNRSVRWVTIRYSPVRFQSERFKRFAHLFCGAKIFCGAKRLYGLSFQRLAKVGENFVLMQIMYFTSKRKTLNCAVGLNQSPDCWQRIYIPILHKLGKQCFPIWKRHHLDQLYKNYEWIYHGYTGLSNRH